MMCLVAYEYLRLASSHLGIVNQCFLIIDCCSLALSCLVSVHLETGGVDIDLQRNGSLAKVNRAFPKGFFKVLKPP